MSRTGQRHAWLLSLGLLAGGVLAAHAFAYRLAVPETDRRHHVLEATGHGYLDEAPLASLCVTLVVVGFVGRMLAGARSSAHPPAWLFALAPPFGFALQEHLERLIHQGAFPFGAVAEPTFLIGLVLQLPFALVALLAATALLAAAATIAERLGDLPRPRVLPANALEASPRLVPAPGGRPLVGARGQRAPPCCRALLVRPGA
jgi:hypothetical protein